MPAVLIKTNVSISEEKKKEILSEATKIMVEAAHKHEEAVMVLYETVDATMGNTPDPLAFVEVRSMVGIDHQTNHDVSERITPLLKETCGVEPDRVYVNFIRIPETCWGLLGGIATWEAARRLWVVNSEPVK
ncbi:MAG: hypothetical protein PWQ57_311 [Desulfovibrionales bacterium]|jgi:phenylpyruvate tautomerase PptA (4-oxalocrotonate tautomerase family)|nr:hypothetical protein [Desulfovibrionales bacterium]